MSEPHTMEQKVTDIIREIGIPVRLRGFFYVREAILLDIENTDFMGATIQKVYLIIAEKHGSTPIRVERAIRTGIGIACRRGNTTFINHLFGPGKAERGITSKRFIEMIACIVINGGLDPAMCEDYPATVIAEP